MKRLESLERWLAILIILTLAGKLFGFWGLILGVPVCTYIFGYAIRLDRPGLFPNIDREGDAPALTELPEITAPSPEKPAE